MPTKPQVKTLNANSVEILNTLRANASPNYQDMVPYAEGSLDSVREIGAIIMQYPALQNEFLSALVNRIGMVLVTSKLYRNPWSFMKQGMLEFGETIEEIFVNIAKPFEFNQERSETTIFKREIPDVRAAFHVMNYTKFYKATISNDQLRQAFLSWNGITDLIARIVDAMYTGANYDEFITMKYLLAKHLIAGNIYANQIDTVSTENMKSIVATIKGVSNSLEFLSNKYNYNGVETYTNKSDQYILVNAKFDATMDVEVLASAFNMDKAEFMGRRVLVDSFGNLDNARLKLLFAEDPNYTEISEDDLQALDNIPAVMVDRYFFMIFDNFYNFTEQYNGEGLYWNYWYHTWKTFSISPFHNAVAFVPGAPTITSVTVEPSTASGAVGSTIQLSAEVVSTNFAPKTVTWSSSSENVTVNSSGLVTIGTGATGPVTITATSTYDSSKSGTCTITVS
ncbi:MAG: hypothetical protein [Bacteriophage sp.]|nr:MAG: hypothetical protein [Bacteriophage sp.]